MVAGPKHGEELRRLLVLNGVEVNKFVGWGTGSRRARSSMIAPSSRQRTPLQTYTAHAAAGAHNRLRPPSRPSAARARWPRRSGTLRRAPPHLHLAGQLLGQILVVILVAAARVDDALRCVRVTAACVGAARATRGAAVLLVAGRADARLLPRGGRGACGVCRAG